MSEMQNDVQQFDNNEYSQAAPMVEIEMENPLP